MSQELDLNTLRRKFDNHETILPEEFSDLLDRVESLQRSCQLLGRIIERDGKNLVELTNSQDIIEEDGDGDWEVVWQRAHEMKAHLERAKAQVARVRAMAQDWDANGNSAP